MGELKSTEVYVKIKDDEHLIYLFEICVNYGFDYIDKFGGFRKYFRFENQYGLYGDYDFYNDYQNKRVTTEQFEQLLKSEQNGH